MAAIKWFGAGHMFVMAAVFILSLPPGLPSEPDTNDYTPELAFTMYLFGGVAITAVLA